MKDSSLRAAAHAIRHWKVNRNAGAAHSQLGFHLSDYLHLLTSDIALRTPELAHLQPERMLFSVTRARNRSVYGLQARVTPLRFRDGLLTRSIRRTTYQVQRYFVDGREILYLITFCIPRFLDQSFHEKLITIFHELYHISPVFDGDLRRHDGRYEFHTHSKDEYDRLMAQLVERYLRARPDAQLIRPLQHTAQTLRELYGGIYGYRIPRPKMLPI